VEYLALFIALVFVFGAIRRMSRRLDALTQSYWELRYDYTRLRSQVSRLDPETVDVAAAEPPGPPAPGSFVPLSSMRKKDK